MSLIIFMERYDFDHAPAPDDGEPLPPPERRESNGRFEQILIRYTEKINEGNNGVILQLRVEELDDLSRDFLVEQGIITEGEKGQVVKLLKLAEPGKLAREFRALKKARDVAHAHYTEHPDYYADIPAPTSFQKIPISARLKEWLASKDVVTNHSTIELMVMDRVEGTDIDTHILRYFLLRSPRSICSKEKQVMSLDFNELEEYAARSYGLHFDFDTPRRQWTDADWRRYAHFRETLEGEVARLGFRIDERTISAIENTMDVLFEKAGMLWGDGNLRNMMLEGLVGATVHSREAKLPKPWLIDFGTAIPVTSLPDPVKQRAESKRVLDRLRRAFMEAERPLRGPEETKKPVIQSRFPKDQIVRWSNQLQVRFDQMEAPPFFMVAQDIQGMAGVWHERLMAALIQLVEDQPAYRAKILRGLKGWFADATAQRHFQQARIRSDLQRLHEWLSETK